MEFKSYHPLINLIYFVCAFVFALWFTDPVFTAIAFICAFLFLLALTGKKAFGLGIGLLVFIIVFTLLYRTFNHFGITNIGETSIGNKITLEATAFGLNLAFRISAAIILIACFVKIFTTDKIVYLFGKISPKFSVFLSFLFRFIPRIKKESNKISKARKGIGRAKGQGSFKNKVKNFMAYFGRLISFSTESTFESLDSMKNRGLGLKGRTAFSIYRFDKRDRAFVIIMFLFIFLTLTAWALDYAIIQYDPEIIIVNKDAASYLFYIIYAFLLLMPTASEVLMKMRFKKVCA